MQNISIRSESIYWSCRNAHAFSFWLLIIRVEWRQPTFFPMLSKGFCVQIGKGRRPSDVVAGFVEPALQVHAVKSMFYSLSDIPVWEIDPIGRNRSLQRNEKLLKWRGCVIQFFFWLIGLWRSLKKLSHVRQRK